MDIMKPTEIIRFQVAEARSTPEGVAGVVLPFNEEFDRPGFDLDAQGNLVFWDTQLYDPRAFDWQLAALNDGERPFMWEHGAIGGQMSLTGIPIGNVTKIVITPQDIRFEALFNETTVAEQVKQVVGVTAIEVSAAIMAEEFVIEKHGNHTTRRITRADLKHVSLVVHGEFPQAKLVSVFCQGCDSFHSHEFAATGSTTLPSHPVHAGREHNARSGDEVTISARDLGLLHARINTLEHEIKVALTNAILDKIQ